MNKSFGFSQCSLNLNSYNELVGVTVPTQSHTNAMFCHRYGREFHIPIANLHETEQIIKFNNITFCPIINKSMYHICSQDYEYIKWDLI